MRDRQLRFLYIFLFGISVLPFITDLSFAEYGDIVMNKTAESMRKVGVKDVLFPHWFHRIRFKCKICHENIFVLKAGKNDINMNLIMRGEKCGVCHNGIGAWESLYCDRCHSLEPGWSPGVIHKSKYNPQVHDKTAASSSRKILDPEDPKSLIYLDAAGEIAGTGDIKKSGVASVYAKIGSGWHPAALIETGLPLDKYGLVDWVKVVIDKRINPQYSLEPDVKPEGEPIFDAKILFEMKGDFTDNVLFPHFIHSWWLSCEICHSTVDGAIFEPVAGNNNIKMTEMVDDKWCGRCHNGVAFPLVDCKRCHNMERTKKPDEGVILRRIPK